VARADPARVVSPGEREQRLLAAARKVLRERGFEADIREILKLAEVGTGTAYRHFSNKEALVRTILDEMRLKVRQGLNAAAQEPDARDAIAACMQVGFEALSSYGQLAVAIFGGTEPREYDSDADRAEMELLFAALLRRGIDQGHFREGLDVAHAVGAWFALVAPRALSRLMYAEGRSVTEIADLTTRFYLTGLSATARVG
jgi:AcrR family transcriptional regulator